jgi:hypothetical protein
MMASEFALALPTRSVVCAAAGTDGAAVSSIAIKARPDRKPRSDAIMDGLPFLAHARVRGANLLYDAAAAG